MPNTAFRIAFWALFISLGLSITAAVLSPRMPLAQALRAETDTLDGLAAHPPAIHLGHPVAFPVDQRTAAADPDALPALNIPAPVLISAEPVIEPTPEVERLVPSPYPAVTAEDLTVSEPAPAMEDLRLAQRDPDNEYVSSELLAPVPPRGVYEELPPPPTEELVQFAPAPDRDVLAQIQELREELARIQLLQLRRETALALEALERDSHGSPRTGTVAMSSATEVPVPNVESREASTAWVPLKPTTVVSTVAPQPEPNVTSAPEQTEEPLEASSIDHSVPDLPILQPDRYVRIVPGEKENRWTFEFKETPVDEVLMVLGDHSGTEVVIESGVEGVYSHTFNEADPKQAFASVVKSFRLGIDLKGDYIFVRRSVIR